MDRPAVGQSVHAEDRLKRCVERRPGVDSYGYRDHKVWKPINEYGWSKGPKPVDGIYIGYRTYADGRRYWEDECGYVFDAEHTFEVWLVVPGPRQNPIPVLPSAVNITSMYTGSQ